MFKIRVNCVIDKSAEKVFEAITDHANYNKFPGIDKSVLVEEGTTVKNGEGALRVISAGIFEFRERIISYEKSSKMAYHIEETNPIPMRHDKGEIRLEPVADKTRVLWLSEGHMNVPLLGSVLDKLVEFQASRVFRIILNHIEES
ncbi:MAG: SRPBCC family protein [Cyanobacteria bacterium P01_F01_bin.53]